MRISVAMCTFNGAKYLREQLDSLATQTRPPDELVIVDDHSSDSSTEIVRDFMQNVPFPVRLETNPRNVGSTRSFEKAILSCKGEIIALADQDDVWQLHKLSLIEQNFLDNPDVGLVFSDAEIVDQDLKPLGSRLWQELGVDERVKDHFRSSTGLSVLLSGHTVTGATMAFRSDFIDLVLPVPGSISLIHDGWIALVIGAVANVTLIDEPLILYRQHESQQIGIRRRTLEAKAPANSRINRFQLRNKYEHLIENLEALIDRLSQQEPSAPALVTLRSRLRHLLARKNLDRRRLKRISPVMAELTSGRYHRYSSGLSSALKDVLVDPPIVN